MVALSAVTALVCGAPVASYAAPAVAAPANPSPGVPNDTSNCSPTTDASTSGAVASTWTEVASGTLDGQAWSLWSAKGQSGALGLEDGGLVIDGRAYGLCPGYPNPAELQLLDVGANGIVAGVVGYPGLAKVRLYQSTAGTRGPPCLRPRPKSSRACRSSSAPCPPPPVPTPRLSSIPPRRAYQPSTTWALAPAWPTRSCP